MPHEIMLPETVTGQQHDSPLIQLGHVDSGKGEIKAVHPNPRAKTKETTDPPHQYSELQFIHEGRLIFEIKPIGLDAMNPHHIEGWHLSVPFSLVNGDIHISVRHTTGKEVGIWTSFTVVGLEDGDQIILKDKKTKKQLELKFSTDPQTMAMSLDVVNGD